MTDAATRTPLSPSRQFVLHLMFSMLVSAAVFVVVAWLVVVPQLAKQEVKIRALESQVAELQETIGEADEDAAPAGAAQGQPAVVPASAQQGQGQAAVPAVAPAAAAAPAAAPAPAPAK